MPSMKIRDGMSQAQIGAWRHYGRKHPFLFAFGPMIGKGLGIVAALAAVYLVGWVLIPHWVLGSIALTIAAGTALALFGRALRQSTARSRIMARASGRSVRAPALGWAYALLIVACAGMGWLALWSPFA
jgi:hypothetical protein